MILLFIEGVYFNRFHGNKFIFYYTRYNKFHNQNHQMVPFTLIEFCLFKFCENSLNFV